MWGERTLFKRKAALLQGQRERLLSRVERAGGRGDAHPEYTRLTRRSKGSQASEPIGKGLRNPCRVCRRLVGLGELRITQLPQKSQRQMDTCRINPAQIRQELPA